MPSLTEPQKLFVIECKAQYIKDADIIEALVATYGEEMNGITPQNLQVYDPGTAVGKLKLSPELKELFRKYRREADENVADIPIANRSYRILRLEAIINDDLHSQNPFMVMKAMEQAAKEMGGQYSAVAMKPAPGVPGPGGTSGGSGNTERADKLNSLLESVRTRRAGENSGAGVSGGDTKPGGTG